MLRVLKIMWDMWEELPDTAISLPNDRGMFYMNDPQITKMTNTLPEQPVRVPDAAKMATVRIREHAQRGKGITLSREDTKLLAEMLEGL